MKDISAKIFRRATASVPLLVTVIIHVVLVAVAGYFVTEQMIGKKKTFEATAATTSITQKKVEHRLQVARKGGGSASASPVSAARIFSTAENALQIPAMPDLPSVGASSLAGIGFGNGMGAIGTGTGYNTGIGASGNLGRGFMSMSFLGVTNQRASKFVFIVDISPALMDIRKGGFRAFEILRHEISRLVSTLPPSNQFNVVLFDGSDVRLFAGELKPATVLNKTEFFEWIKPINAELSSLGGRSIPSSSPRWRFTRDEALKLDPEYGPPPWVQAIHSALEQKPEIVYVITGSASPGQMRLDDETITRRQREKEAQLAELESQGLDFKAISSARGKALAKLRAELKEINRKLVAQNKDPFVVTDIGRVLDADFKAALRKAGFQPLTLDTAGWTDKAGKPIWTDFTTNVGKTQNAEFEDVVSHVSKLQFGLLAQRASLNFFLFIGPDEKQDSLQKKLSTMAVRNGGRFTLLTIAGLEEISRAAAEDK